MESSAFIRLYSFESQPKKSLPAAGGSRGHESTENFHLFESIFQPVPTGAPYYSYYPGSTLVLLL